MNEPPAPLRDAADGDRSSPPTVVTALLARAGQGDSRATDELFPLVYDELRHLADRILSREPSGQTLQPTALVHEAYLRLVGSHESGWQNRAHFFGAAARAIRRILIDHARARRRDKRGSGVRPLPLAAADDLGVDGPSLDVLALDEALQRLAGLDAQKEQLVELRFFGGLTGEEAAAVLGISASTAARDWQFARIWLHRELTRERAR
jgi:RNA polymerase sigma factor (TIGR02999 family)